MTKPLDALQGLLSQLPEHLREDALQELQLAAQEQQIYKEENAILREANRRLRGAQEHFSSLYHEAPAPYFIFDANGRIFAVNNAGSALLQTNKELDGAPFSSFLSTQSQETFSQHLQQVYTHHRRYRCELMLHPAGEANNSREAVEVTLDSAWIEHNAKSDGFCLSTCTDISTFKRLQEKIDEARVHAEKASSLKSQFLANMSHEIRTPLSSVLGYVDLLRQDIKEPEPHERLEIVYRAGKHLLFLLNEIIDLSRIEHGRFSLQKSAFLPSALFDGLQELFEIAAENNQIRLDFVRNHVPEPLLGDAERIRQIMVNIIGNALKFTPAQGTVYVNVSYHHEHLCIDVRDTGPGIPKDQLEAIFEMFHQADGSDTRTHGGSGLGLAISQKLSRLMGGMIEVQSQIGEGATFSVRIPVTLADDGDSIDDVSGILPAPFQPTDNNAIPRVLIVDDDRVLQRLLGIFITRMGYEHDIAKHGEEALQFIEQTHYDLVLLDLQMPVMDGYQTVTNIRAMPKFRDLPVLALTAKAIQEDLNKCIRAGCDSYITKPVVFKQLAQQVHRYLQPMTPNP